MRNKEGSGPEAGSTKFNFKDKYTNKEQTTGATIGNGQVTTGQDTKELADLNRDINKAQEKTKDESGGMSISGEVDNRYFDDPGKALAEDVQAVTEFGDNVGKAAKRVGYAADDLVDSVVKNGLDVDKAADAYNNKTAHREGLSRLSKEEVDVVNNPDDHSEASKQVVAQKYMDGYTDVRGIDKGEVNLFDDKQLANPIDEKGLDKQNMIGMTDGNKEKNDIYLEKDKINEKDNFIRAIGQEAKRHDLAERGIKNETPDGVSTEYDKEAAANNEFAKQALEQEQFFKGPKQENKVGSYVYENEIEQKQNESLVRAGSKKADGVQDAQPFVQAMAAGAAIGAGLDYATQVAVNKIERKTWAVSVTDINKTSVAASAVAGASGAGLAAGLTKLNSVVKLGKVAAVGASVAVDAATSAGSQYLKNDGEVDPKKVIIDVSAGQIIKIPIKMVMTIFGKNGIRIWESNFLVFNFKF